MQITKLSIIIFLSFIIIFKLFVECFRCIVSLNKSKKFNFNIEKVMLCVDLLMDHIR